MGAQRYRSLTILAMPIASAIPIANKLGDADRLSDPDRYNHGDADRPGSGAPGPRPRARALGRGPGRGDGPGVLASKALWPKPSKAHAAMAAMATLDGALQSDEMLRLVVAFVPEERQAWYWTKRCWYCRLLRLREIRRIMHALTYRNAPGWPPGISQDFMLQLSACRNVLEQIHLRNSAYRRWRTRD